MKFIVGTARAAIAALVLATLGGCVVVPAHRYYHHPRAEVDVDVSLPIYVEPGRHHRPRRPGY